MIRTNNCRHCDECIVWMITARGRRMPVNAESVDEVDIEYSDGMPMFDAKLGHESHFATCPGAHIERRPR